MDAEWVAQKGVRSTAIIEWLCRYRLDGRLILCKVITNQPNRVLLVFVNLKVHLDGNRGWI